MNIKPFLDKLDELETYMNLKEGFIYYYLFDEILKGNGHNLEYAQGTIMRIYPEGKRLSTLGTYEPKSDTINVYIASIMWEAVKNGYVNDYERIGEEFANTVMHEFRHSMQFKDEDDILPRPDAKAYHNEDGTVNEKYWKDEGEIDARNYAKMCVKFMRGHSKQLLKKLGRFVRFYCYFTDWELLDELKEN